MADIDPLIVEVVRQRLVNIAEEGEAIILRTAYSATIAEAADFALAVFDADQRLLAQTPRALGSFIGTLAFGLRNLLDHFPPDTLQPGDTLITNDPWLGAGHLPDIIAISPIFADRRIVGYAANVAHVSDIGGKPSAENEEMYEEGLLIPPCRLYEAGRLNDTVIAFITGNSRLPQQVSGDVQALNAANRAVEKRVQAMLQEYGLPDLELFSEDLQQRAEHAVRARIADLPDGEYQGQAYSDGADHPITISARITISGDSLEVDYSGTSDQVPWGLNVPFNLTFAETLYALRLAIAPDIPSVGGAIAPFAVTAPEGSILNPRRPAATMIRVTVVQNVYAAIFSALQELIGDHIEPNHVHAHFGGIWAFRFLGTYHETPSAFALGGPPQINSTFAEAYFFNGGAGALGTVDGLNTVSMPVNCAAIPVEIMEARTPVLFEHKRYVADSGGPGEFRGGVGQEVAVRVLSDSPIKFVPGTNDRVDHPPVGMFGGHPGRGGGIWIDGEPAHRRKGTPVSRDQIITVAIPGGGGWGDPIRRSRRAVEQDIRSGIVTEAAATRDYPSSESPPTNNKERNA